MRSFVVLEPFDKAHALVTSPLLSSRALAAIRLSVACYTFVVLAVSITWGIVFEHDAAGCVCPSSFAPYCTGH